MAATKYLIGNDGNAAIASEDTIAIRSFAATLSRNASDITAFGDTGRRLKLGFLDLTGSLNGVPMVGTTTTSAATSIFYAKTTLPVLTLTLMSDGTSVANIVSTVAFSSFAFNSDKTGDSTVSATFANGSGAAPVLTWST